MFMAARCSQLDAQHSLGLKWKEETSVATDEFLREAAARRTVLAACVLTCSCTLSEAQAASLGQQEADARTSPYIQELLRRSEEQRAVRAKERLDAYNRKVFREYFDFEAGTAGASRARGLSADTQAAIQAWQERNTEKKH